MGTLIIHKWQNQKTLRNKNLQVRIANKYWLSNYIFKAEISVRPSLRNWHVNTKTLSRDNVSCCLDYTNFLVILKKTKFKVMWRCATYHDQP